MVLKILPAFMVFGLMISGCGYNNDWRSARRDSAGIAPDPLTTTEAVVQVYGADAWGWRGLFAIHTWIAVKPSGHEHYTVYDVVGWRSYRGRPVMNVTRDIPDRYWYGSRPQLLKSHRGPGVDSMIAAIDRAALDYPWKNNYKAFPGPNSNTFVAWIARQVPELELHLPFRAVGSGFIE
jgi:hypothetical protein